eukprot:COSAG04_NODE_7341_length_1144_cov_1.293780_2_plen_107_part_01
MPSGAPALLGLAVLCAAPLRAACECWPRDSRVDAWDDDVCSGLGPAECEGNGNSTTGERCCWGCRDNEMLQFVGTVRPNGRSFHVAPHCALVDMTVSLHDGVAPVFA